MFRTLFTYIFLLISSGILGNIVDSKIFINRDSLTTSTGLKFPYISFNSNSSFNTENERIIVSMGDTLDLWVVNNDTAEHIFDIKNFNINTSVLPGDSINIFQEFNTSGVFIFYDSKDYPNNKYMGLSGMIVVTDHNHSSFFWNIKDHQSSWNDSISAGMNVNWQNYSPNFFTINGKSNPNINNDMNARVQGSVGDTLIINIVNSGSGIHSLHFHGYHLEILNSSKFPNHNGISKDTFGIYPMETLILQLIPDKTGEYPVHDHNLLATSGGNVYPFGMFTTMLIQ